MKKILSLFAVLLFAGSMMAADWTAIEFLGDGAGGGLYANKYKMSAPTASGIVNIQKPGFADEVGIYVTFPAAITDCSLTGKAVQGAGMVIYLSNFTAQETSFTVTDGNNTVHNCEVYYADGTIEINPEAAVSASSGNAALGCDGLNNTRWESDHSDNQWWCVNYGEQRTFNTVRIVWEGAYGKSFDIFGSNDAVNWTVLKEVRNQTLAGFPYTQDIDLESSVTYQYVKFQGITRGTQYGYSFYEFSVWENTLIASDLVKVHNIIIDMASATTYTLAATTDYTTSSTGTITYASNKESVAIVNADGQITAVGVGTATITLSQAADAAYKAGNITIDIYVQNTSYGPIDVPTAPTNPAAQVRAIYGSHYDLAVNATYNTDNWGSSALTEERIIGTDKVRVYKMTNGVIVWGNNGSTDAASIKGIDGYRSGSYTGLDASLMEYMHVDIWCDHERNFTSIINDNGRGAQGNTTANAWKSYNVALADINHGEAGVENVRWMKFDGFAENDVVAIANVYFYTTQDGSDTEAPAVTSATYVAESATYTTAQVTVVATDNVGITAVHFVDATNNYDKSYSVTSATSLNETITLTGLKSGKTYNFTVTAKDATGNETATGATVQVVTPAIEGNNKVFYGSEVRTINWEKVDYNCSLNYRLVWNTNGSVSAEMYLDDPDGMQTQPGFVCQILDYVTNNGNPIYYTMTINENGVYTATMEGPFEQGKNDFRFRIAGGTTTEHPREVYHVGDENNTYNRNSLTSGNFGTLCLPFDAEVTGATLYTITGKNETDGTLQSVNLTEVANNKAEAGKAYIFQATSSVLSATYTAVAAHGTNTAIVGNLSATAKTITAADNAYIIGSDNKLHLISGTATATIGQYKAYIKLSELSANAASHVSMIIGEEQTVTDIEDVNAIETIKRIENGQLVIIKNGVRYNAMGQVIR